MKNEYKDILFRVKKIINESDFIGLLKQGSPKDEYDDEVHKIAAGIKMCDNIEKTQKLIYNVFKESFEQDAAGDIILYFDVAKRIFEEIRS